MAIPSLSGSPPNIELTQAQSNALLVGLELEQMGWIGAAHALRKKHFPYLPWDNPKMRGCTAQGFEIMLRIHHGSLPPYAPQPVRDTFPLLPPKQPVHHGLPPAGQHITPAPRADQIQA